jgi:hypothetical protein
MSQAHAIGVMDRLASQTWHFLRACYDRKIRVDEDAITTQLLIARCPPAFSSGRV